MNAADVIWRLVAAGVIHGTTVRVACEVLELSNRDLDAARARYECPTPERSVPLVAVKPIPNAAVVGSVNTSTTVGRQSRAFVPKLTYTEAGRRRAAERIFATFRAQEFACDLCGEDVRPGDLFVVDRAHHQFCKGAA